MPEKIFLSYAKEDSGLVRDVLDALRKHHLVATDVVFLDPPYDREREYAAALDQLGADPPPLVVAQHSKFIALGDDYGSLHRTRVLRQGDNVLSFYSVRKYKDAV